MAEECEALGGGLRSDARVDEEGEGMAGILDIGIVAGLEGDIVESGVGQAAETATAMLEVRDRLEAIEGAGIVGD